MEYSQKQLEIINKATRDILSNTKEVIIGGLAGTGKTTCVNKILELIKNKKYYLVLTPTGKAANVLRQKGVPAATIHSAIYNYKGKRMQEGTDREIMIWKKKNQIKKDPDIVFVDEASMVDGKMYNDVMNFGVQVVWIGDYGQLPPIGSDPKIMEKPTYTLTEIFRQGENSGIVTFAHDIRNNSVDDNEYNNVEFVASHWKSLDLLSFDQIICAYNLQRREINSECRRRLGYQDILNVGDKLICLKNNKELDIYNGQLVWVKKLHDRETPFRIYATLVTETGDETDVWINKSGLIQDKPDETKFSKGELICDYGYAITAHKSQGSEWPNVLVIYNESNNWDNARWLYTAATRASEHLTVKI